MDIYWYSPSSSAARRHYDHHGLKFRAWISFLKSRCAKKKRWGCKVCLLPKYGDHKAGGLLLLFRPVLIFHLLHPLCEWKCHFLNRTRTYFVYGSFLIFFRVAFIVSGRRRVAHLPRHLEEKKILRSTRSLTSLRKRGIFFSTRFSLPIDPLPTSKKSHDLSIKLTLVVRLFRVVPYRRIFLGITNCQAEKRILFSHVPNLGLCRRMLFFRSFQHVKYVVKRSKGANLGRRRFNSLFAHF